MLSVRPLLNPEPRELSQVIALFRAEDWWGDEPENPEIMKRMILGSVEFVIAEEDGRIVGMGRAIGDGISDAYIQDVAVIKEFRGRGIGAQIIRELSGRLAALGVHWVGLIAEPGTRGFYEPLGFEVMAGAVAMKKRP